MTVAQPDTGSELAVAILCVALGADRAKLLWDRLTPEQRTEAAEVAEAEFGAELRNAVDAILSWHAKAEER